MVLNKNTQNILLIIITIISIIILIYIFVNSSYQFGDIIDTFDGVDAYSNQKGETNCTDVNYYNGIYTGIKWQCVEFVRRYLIIRHGITFSEVDHAFEIPNAQFRKLNGSHVQTTSDLKVGSIIVWPKNYEYNFPDGHVAIVSAVSHSGINVVEQNYHDIKRRFIDLNQLQNVTIIGLV